MPEKTPENIGSTRQGAQQAEREVEQLPLEERAHAPYALQGVDLLHCGVRWQSADVQGSPDLLQRLCFLEVDVWQGGAELAEYGGGILDDAGAHGQREVLDMRERQHAPRPVLVEGGTPEKFDQGRNHRLGLPVKPRPEEGTNVDIIITTTTTTTFPFFFLCYYHHRSRCCCAHCRLPECLDGCKTL